MKRHDCRLPEWLDYVLRKDKPNGPHRPGIIIEEQAQTVELLNCYTGTDKRSFLSRLNHHGYFIELFFVRTGREGES